jgi:hypothetical protein
MIHKRGIFVVSCVLILAILACSLPFSAPTDQVPVDQALTMAVSTLQAQTQQAPPGPISDQPLPPPPTSTLTSTPSIPMVSVSENTNCRTGPGQDYDIIGALLIGQKAEVVGKYTPANYWIIKNPTGNDTCWLWGQYATVEGDTSGLPEMTPPPTPTPALPKAPGGLSESHVCKTLLVPNPPHVSMVNVELHWNDKSDNEEGFRVYRDGTMVADLGPNSESYSENPGGLDHIYWVEAYNAAGASARNEVNVTCP